MTENFKDNLKKVLGDLPLAAEAYWYLAQAGRPPRGHFSLENLAEVLPDWRQQVEEAAWKARDGKRILVFATLHYWIEHAALLSLALSGMGHQVTLAFLPYGEWKQPHDRFDLRRRNLYALKVLRHAEPFLHVISFLNQKKVQDLPNGLLPTIRDNAFRDTQYSLQVEDIDPNSRLYQLRLERDSLAGEAAFNWLKNNLPDTVVVPNGSILEFSAIYQAARYLGIPVVTYEFGEQRERIWLAQDAEVMRQETDDLWEARKALPLEPEQLDQVRALFAARQRASLWENFARRWQGVPSEGGEKVRSELALDGRPVVLLATNVIGDSLTLGRQVFSDSMTTWLERTMQYFAAHRNVQFVVRIHPGELITKGPSVADVVRRTLPDLPEHIHLVPADAKVNTYDIVEIADLGLVYTTTVGLEMAMSGVPVLAVGRTHYRGKGFTLDPDTWEGYFSILDRALADLEGYRLSQQQVEQAWNYAYRFFFEYPHPFPWHVVHLWKDVREWPLKRVLSEEGQECYGNTFRYLSGEEIQW